MSDNTPQTAAGESRHGLPAELFAGNRKDRFTALCRFSVGFQEIAKITGDTVNAQILEIYSRRTGAKNWKKFKEWREEGYKIKKGEKGFPVFSAPKNFGSKKTDEAPETKPADSEKSEENKPKQYTLAYLFNNLQIE